MTFTCVVQPVTEAQQHALAGARRAEGLCSCSPGTQARLCYVCEHALCIVLVCGCIVPVRVCAHACVRICTFAHRFSHVRLHMVVLRPTQAHLVLAGQVALAPATIVLLVLQHELARPAHGLQRAAHAGTASSA